MKSTRIQDIERPAGQGVFAQLLLDGEKSNVRLIRLGAGQAPPPHRRGSSELMLYVVSGDGELVVPDGAVLLSAGALACFQATRSCWCVTLGPPS